MPSSTLGSVSRRLLTRGLATALLALGLAQGCAHRAPSAPGAAGEAVTLTPLTDGVWIHTTWETLPGLGPVASNGLLACEGGDGLLVDTAWNDAQTAQLLDLAAARGCPVRALFVTHSHQDRMGGLAEVLRRGLATYASADTVARAKVQGWSPTLVDRLDEVRAGQVSAEGFYPGPAHTPDNMVLWLPKSQVLFAGCMVRAASDTTLGNVADADLVEWPESMRHLLAIYGDATHVVPGHGAAGDGELLVHTLTLAVAAQPKNR